MLTTTQAEGLLNALRDIHECGIECAQGCTLESLEPVLPGDREIIAALVAA